MASIRLLTDLNKGMESYYTFNEHKYTTTELLSIWKNYGVESSKSILAGVTKINDAIHNYPLRKVYPEVCDGIEIDMPSHPVLLVDFLACFLRVVSNIWLKPIAMRFRKSKL